MWVEVVLRGRIGYSGLIVVGDELRPVGTNSRSRRPSIANGIAASN